jgi:hypothetical protein
MKLFISVFIFIVIGPYVQSTNSNSTRKFLCRKNTYNRNEVKLIGKYIRHIKVIQKSITVLQFTASVYFYAELLSVGLFKVYNENARVRHRCIDKELFQTTLRSVMHLLFIKTLPDHLLLIITCLVACSYVHKNVRNCAAL